MDMTRLLAFFCIGFIGWGIDPAAFAQSPCLAQPDSAPEGPLHYALRDGRCEGALSVYVGQRGAISLIGYGTGVLNAELPAATLYMLPDAPVPLTLRALSLTSRQRYQMDMLSTGPGPMRWPLDLVRRARTDPHLMLKPAGVGLLACSKRCASRPDTVYYPVALEGDGVTARLPPSLRLRADGYADAVQVRLRPYGSGGAMLPADTEGLELYPDDITSVPLPAGLTPGLYLLEVRATSLDSRQPLPPLLARIHVP